ncbi:MAG: copper-binding protein [Caulobacteraceae bacterium]
MADDMSGMSMSSTAKHGRGSGVIKAIDPKASTITIQHGPIPTVGWPAMTMTFKAEPATLLKGLKVGEAIAFDCTVRGMAAEMTAVRPR